jgi:hypothetical protein
MGGEKAAESLRKPFYGRNGGAWYVWMGNCQPSGVLSKKKGEGF